MWLEGSKWGEKIESGTISFNVGLEVQSGVRRFKVGLEDFKWGLED